MHSPLDLPVNVPATGRGRDQITAIGGGGPFPTMVGLNFDQLLQLLGVPVAPNAASAAYGTLPGKYPARWN